SGPKKANRKTNMYFKKRITASAPPDLWPMEMEKRRPPFAWQTRSMFEPSATGGARELADVFLFGGFPRWRFGEIRLPNYRAIQRPRLARTRGTSMPLSRTFFSRMSGLAPRRA